MPFSFFDWLKPKNGTVTTSEVQCEELFEAAQEFQVRELCFWICVDMVANALGRCEFRTFRGNKEIFEREYYLWNFEPNQNQNSTAFLHKLVAKLFENNEALIFNPRGRVGGDSLVVADSYELPEQMATRENRYTAVVVGESLIERSLGEKDVLHLVLNHMDIRPVLNRLYASYWKLVEAAMKNYQWDRGQHWKVHVNQIAAGSDGWAKNFQQMIKDQIKPFLDSNGAILPEFDGYEYSNVGGTYKSDTRDIRAMVEDIFDFTARSMQIPAVLVNGTIEGTADANARFLTYCIDPLCDQLQEEITRKRYGYEQWRRGDFLRVDSSAILHFDLFAQAANIEKLIGSGAYTINDIRRAASQAPIREPWADQHYMTLNIAGVGEQTRQLEGGEKQ